jgi:hypothetical protein
MGKEIRVDPAFEEKFKELNEFLKTKFGCPDFKLEDFELDKIDNTKFESTILKFAICKAFGISVYSGYSNPWYGCFTVVRSEEPLGYHGSMADKVSIRFDLNLTRTVGYEIYDLVTISDEQIEFIKTFREKYKTFKEEIEIIKSEFFPIVINEK